MPEPPASSQHSQKSIADEVRELLRALPRRALPLRQLGRIVGSSATAISEWQTGKGTIVLAKQRRVRELVRQQFAEHAQCVAALTRSYGILDQESVGEQLHPIFAASKPRPASQLKALVVRIGNGGSRAEHKLAERLFRLLPELRNL